MSMKHILPLPEGSKVSLYDVNYFAPKRAKSHLFITYRDTEHKKHVHDITEPLMEIYFTKPEYRNFKTAREYIEIDKTYPVKTKAYKVTDVIANEMRQDTSGNPVTQLYLEMYDDAVASNNWRAKKQVLHWPYTQMSDLDIETYYWIHMGYHYDTDTPHMIDKCFADIENDIFGITSAEANANLDPVNACTLIFDFDEHGINKDKKPQVYTYLLRNHDRYPQQAEFERRLSEFYDVCHMHFDKQTVIKKDKKKVIDTEADYHIKLFDQEEMLLKAIFDTINYYKPDICAFWNMPYDMPKMKARMELLGMDPVDIMTDSSMFPKNGRFVDYHMDYRAIDIAERNSYIRMASTTKYIDQMQHYANIRKGQKAYGSNALDNIANIELGMGKWKFRKGVDVTNACVHDYWNFVLYNIRDVWCQVLIDRTTTDIMGMIYDMNQMNCPLHHLAKQTKYQRYIYYCRLLRKGYVPGNNINVDYLNKSNDKKREEEIRRRREQRNRLDDEFENEFPGDLIQQQREEDDDDDVLELIEEGGGTDTEEKSSSDIVNTMVDELKNNQESIYCDYPKRKIPLQGGVVGNPDFNLPNGEVLIQGIHSKHVHHDVMDMDYSSEYPYAKITRSISRSTQVGRIIIPVKVSQYQNMLPLGKQKRKEDLKLYVPGAEWISDYLSQDYLSFGTCWYNLPFVDECEELIREKLKGDKKEITHELETVYHNDEKSKALTVQDVTDASSDAHAIL